MTAELFKRENRYLVVKCANMDEALSEPERETLSNLFMKIDSHRHATGKPALQGVFVESDWPEYEAVWQMIENRVSNSKLGHANQPGSQRFSQLRSILNQTIRNWRNSSMGRNSTWVTLVLNAVIYGLVAATVLPIALVIADPAFKSINLELFGSWLFTFEQYLNYLRSSAHHNIWVCMSGGILGIYLMFDSLIHAESNDVNEVGKS